MKRRLQNFKKNLTVTHFLTRPKIWSGALKLPIMGTKKCGCVIYCRKPMKSRFQKVQKN